MLGQQALGSHKSLFQRRGGGIDTILAFSDNNPQKWQGKVELSVNSKSYTKEIIPPNQITNYDFDTILVTSLMGYESIKKQLLQMGIAEDKTDISHSKGSLEARNSFAKNFALLCEKFDIQGNVAELGVFQGEFAKKINEFFPNRKCFLFDTFEGFDQRDLQYENQSVQRLGAYFNDTGVDLVMSKMPNPHNVIIKKGWFPQSAVGLEDEKFAFVNIDTDLYTSILSGLEFFYPKMNEGGVILIHDYFGLEFAGVKKAVDEFCKTNALKPFCIGDDLSIALQKA